MAAARRRRYRTTKMIQAFWENEIYELATMKEFLEEGQEGYIAGQNVKNPNFIESPGQCLKMQMTGMVKLQSLLLFHEAEHRIEAAEQKFIQLLAVIQEKVPFLLPGVIDDEQGTGSFQ